MCSFRPYMPILRLSNRSRIVYVAGTVGSCYDNAAAESFFGLLKRERVNRRRYVTRAEARADIFDYIERFHNQRKRRKLDRINQTALN